MFVLGSCHRRVRRCPLRPRERLRATHRLHGRARPRDLRDAHRGRHRLALGAGARRGVLRVAAALPAAPRSRGVRPPDPRVQPDHLRRGAAVDHDLHARGPRRDRPTNSGLDSNGARHPRGGPGSPTCSGSRSRRSSRPTRDAERAHAAAECRRSSRRRRCGGPRRGTGHPAGRGHRGELRRRRRRRRREPRDDRGADPRIGGTERQRQDDLRERADGVVPSSGALEVDGEPVPLCVPGRARRAGLLRTYQAPQTYDHLSCVEDVLLSTADRQRTGILSSWFLRPSVLRHEQERWRRAVRGDRAGGPRRARRDAGRPAHVRPTTAARARPRNRRAAEGADARRTVRRSRRRRDRASSRGYLRDLRDEGVSLFVIDHKLDFITGLCDRVAVFELGHLVAVGDAATVFQDQRVVDAYLGVAEVD